MSSEEESNKPIHFRPNKRFAEELKRYMGIHKIDNKTEAIHGIFEEWFILTEQQKIAPTGENKENPQSFSFPCDYRGKDDKGKPFCRAKSLPFITKFLSPDTCQMCLKWRLQQEEEINKLKQENPEFAAFCKARRF